jgi:pimeloyl-ACP methyl ester carboxylesterase
MGVTLNGIEMEWRERGEGDAIVFVHGFPFNSAMWEPQLAQLPPGWWGIAPDLRGFGASMDGPEDVYSMELFARDLAALLDHLEIERAVVCGLSMGGYIAFEFWRLFPDRVRALVLCDTRCDADSPDAKQARSRLAERVRVEGTGPVVEALLPKVVALTTRMTQPGVVQFVRAMMQETPPETMARALIGMAERNDAEPVLRTIDVPVLVVMGADDAITGRGPLEMLARGIRGARMETIENAGHLPNLEQTTAYNRVLAAFLTGLPVLSLSVRSLMRF